MVVLSVIVATKNRLKLLPGLLESFRKQDLDNSLFEVVIIDSSTDGSWEWLKSQRDSWLSVYREEKLGVAAGRQKGIENAKGERLLFIDDDVIAEPDVFKLHLEAHKKMPNASFIGKTIFDWDKSDDMLLRYVGVTFHPKWYNDNLYELNYRNYFTGNMSSNKKAVIEVGGFDRSYSCYGYEDVDLGYRLEKAGYPLYYMKNAVVKDIGNTTSQDYIRKTIEGGKMKAHMISLHPELTREYRRNFYIPYLYPFFWVYIHTIGFFIERLRIKPKPGQKMPKYMLIHYQIVLWYFQAKGWLAYKRNL